jgi:dehydrogenase/reductase SDR family protein 13
LSNLWYCRNWERTRTALGDLRKRSGNNDIHFIKLDLASLQSVREFAQDFLARYDR